MTTDLILVSEYFSLTCAIVFTLLGTIGNGLVIVVYTRNEMRKYPMSTYAVCLAIVDILQIAAFWPQHFITFCPWFSSDLKCKLINFVINTTFYYSAWTVVIISVDRMLDVLFPFRFQYRHKLWFQMVIIAVSYLILFTIPLPVVIYYKEHTNEKSVYNCEIPSHVTQFTISLLDLLFGALLPFIIMFTCTLVIVMKLYYSKISLATRTNLNREKQFAKTLVGMNLFFLLCHAQSA